MSVSLLVTWKYQLLRRLCWLNEAWLYHSIFHNRGRFQNMFVSAIVSLQFYQLAPSPEVAVLCWCQAPDWTGFLPWVLRKRFHPFEQLSCYHASLWLPPWQGLGLVWLSPVYMPGKSTWMASHLHHLCFSSQESKAPPQWAKLMPFYFEISLDSHADLKSSRFPSTSHPVSTNSIILENYNINHNQESDIDTIHQPYSDFSSFHVVICVYV